MDRFSCVVDCDNVDGSQFAGATIIALLDGGGLDAYQVTGTFVDDGGDNADATAVAPEPMTFLLMGGLLALGLIGRRRLSR